MKKLFNLFANVLLFCAILCLQVSANENDTLSRIIVSKAIDPFELSLEELGKVVITATKIPQLTSKITQKVDVINEQQIKNIISNNRNISDYIQYLPGASVKTLSRNDANWGAYGGIGPKYNTYMIEGLSIDDFIDPMGINEMAIQRIEVQRGPASILYPNYLSQDFAGNQCPLAGTVNLILKEEIKEPQTMFGFNYGSYNTFTLNAYHEDKLGILNLLGGIIYERSEYTNYGATNSWLEMQKSPEYDKERAFINASLYLDAMDKHKISMFVSQAYHSGDVGRVNRKFENNYDLINLSYLGQLTDDIKLTFRTGLRFYNRSWQEDNYDDSNKSQSLRETDGVKQIIIPSDISIAYSHFNNSVLTFGIDNQQAFYSTSAELAEKNKETQNDASAKQTGAYIQEDYQINKFTLRGGLRFNYISYNIDKLNGNSPGANKQSWNVILWSSGLKYRYSDEFILFANAGSSFMSPGLKSIGGTIPSSDIYVLGMSGQLPNPNLKPESGVSMDLGFDYKLLLNIDVSIRVFYSRIYDAIIENVISQNPSQTMSVNANGKTNIQGFELGLKQRIYRNFDWFANITLTKSKIIDPDNPDQDGMEVPFVPNITGNLGLRLSAPLGIEVTPALHYSGRIYDSSSKKGRNSFDGKEILNLVINKMFDYWGDKKLTAYLKFYNITNNKFEMPWQFQDPGSNFTIGANVAL